MEVVAGFFAEESCGVAEGVDGDMGGIDTGAVEVFFEKAADHLGGEWRLRSIRLDIWKIESIVV